MTNINQFFTSKCCEFGSFCLCFLDSHVLLLFKSGFLSKIVNKISITIYNVVLMIVNLEIWWIWDLIGLDNIISLNQKKIYFEGNSYWLFVTVWNVRYDIEKNYHFIPSLCNGSVFNRLMYLNLHPQQKKYQLMELYIYSYN